MRQIIARHDAEADTSPGAGPRGKRPIPLSRAGIIGVAAACAVLAVKLYRGVELQTDMTALLPV
ncbi:MAG: hypothetical protein WAK83_24575, partial [Trebonia sp.]|uniref:hypothetical protein n=1 Tax=Trebonia sp. TaxID=2767075 RepID=UPI003BAEEB42